MRNSPVVCLLITSMAKRILDVVSTVVTKFKFCPEEERCKYDGGLWAHGVLWQLCYDVTVF